MWEPFKHGDYQLRWSDAMKGAQEKERKERMNAVIAIAQMNTSVWIKIEYFFITSYYVCIEKEMPALTSLFQWIWIHIWLAARVWATTGGQYNIFQPFVMENHRKLLNFRNRRLHWMQRAAPARASDHSKTRRLHLDTKYPNLKSSYPI